MNLLTWHVDVILEGMGVHQVEPPYKAEGWDLLRRRAMHRPPIKPRRTQRARPNHALMHVQPTVGQLPAIRTPSSECQHLPAPRQLPPYGIVASVFITATTLTTAPDTVTSILATEPFALASTRATGRIDASPNTFPSTAASTNNPAAVVAIATAAATNAAIATASITAIAAKVVFFTPTTNKMKPDPSTVFGKQQPPRPAMSPTPWLRISRHLLHRRRHRHLFIWAPPTVQPNGTTHPASPPIIPSSHHRCGNPFTFGKQLRPPHPRLPILHDWTPGKYLLAPPHSRNAHAKLPPQP